jgi:hypothetical protein
VGYFEHSSPVPSGVEALPNYESMNQALRNITAKVIVVLTIPAFLVLRFFHHARRLFRLTAGKNPDDR